MIRTGNAAMVVGLGVAATLLALLVAAPGAKQRPSAARRPGLNSILDGEGIPATSEQPASGAQTGGTPQPEAVTFPSNRQVAADAEGNGETVEPAPDFLTDERLPAVLNLLLGQTNPVRVELGLSLTRRWAESDGPAAASWAERLSGRSFQGEALRQAALGWARTDLAAASAWAKGLPEDIDRRPALLSLGYEASRTEPLAALELAQALPSTPERDELLTHAVRQWASLDPSAVARWAFNLPDASLRERLTSAVAVTAADQDGAGAATAVAAWLANGPEQQRAAVAVAQRWVQSSPQDAASWVSSFSDAPTRAAAVQNVVTVWAVQDSDAAGAWVRSLPEGRLRELGMETYALATDARKGASEGSASEPLP